MQVEDAATDERNFMLYRFVTSSMVGRRNLAGRAGGTWEGRVVVVVVVLDQGDDAEPSESQRPSKGRTSKRTPKRSELMSRRGRDLTELTKLKRAK